MVHKILKTGTNLITRRQTNILSAAAVLMMAIFASRILGLLRDRLLAGAFFVKGNEWQLDVYFAAFRIPDMLFQLLVLGALSAAFIPVFSQLSDQDKDGAWDVASTIINIGSLVFLAISVVIFLWTPFFCGLIAPNYNATELNLMVNLTRLMLLAQLFFIVSNILTGILQSYQRFLVPALAPVAYNAGIILGIIILTPYWGIYGATVGVVLGAFLHFIIQLPLALHLGFVYRPIMSFGNASVKRIGKLMIPRTLALAVSQIEMTVAVFVATSLAAGSLSIFYFAQHLNDLPVGLFGLTIGQAALPTLSVEAGRSIEQFRKVLSGCLRQILYLSLPASVLLLVLRIPVVRLAYGAKGFPWEATLTTGKVVALFAISIFAQAIIQVLIRAFYALQDTRTPFYTSCGAVIVNVFLSITLALTYHLGVGGLALATSIASIIHAFILIYLLQTKTFFVTKETFVVPVLKMIIATVLTGLALWLPMRLLDQFILDTTRTPQLIMLTGSVSVIGFGVYLLLSYLLRIEELGKLHQLFYRFGAWREVLASSDEMLEDTKATSTSLPEKG